MKNAFLRGEVNRKEFLNQFEKLIEETSRCTATESDAAKTDKAQAVVRDLVDLIKSSISSSVFDHQKYSALALRILARNYPKDTKIGEWMQTDLEGSIYGWTDDISLFIITNCPQTTELNQQSVADETASESDPSNAQEKSQITNSNSQQTLIESEQTGDRAVTIEVVQLVPFIDKSQLSIALKKFHFYSASNHSETLFEKVLMCLAISPSAKSFALSQGISVRLL